MTDLDTLKIDSLYQEMKRKERDVWKKEGKPLNSKEWLQKCERLWEEATIKFEKTPW